MNSPAGSAPTYDEVVLGRRSIRGYKPDPVPKALIREVIETFPANPVVSRRKSVDEGAVFIGFDEG